MPDQVMPLSNSLNPVRTLANPTAPQTSTAGNARITPQLTLPQSLSLAPVQTVA